MLRRWYVLGAVALVLLSAELANGMEEKELSDEYLSDVSQENIELGAWDFIRKAGKASGDDVKEGGKVYKQIQKYQKEAREKHKRELLQKLADKSLPKALRDEYAKELLAEEQDQLIAKERSDKFWSDVSQVDVKLGSGAKTGQVADEAVKEGGKVFEQIQKDQKEAHDKRKRALLQKIADKSLPRAKRDDYTKELLAEEENYRKPKERSDKYLSDVSQENFND